MDFSVEYQNFQKYMVFMLLFSEFSNALEESTVELVFVWDL